SAPHGHVLHSCRGSVWILFRKSRSKTVSPSLAGNYLSPSGSDACRMTPRSVVWQNARKFSQEFVHEARSPRGEVLGHGGKWRREHCNGEVSDASPARGPLRV